jgi:uncharacterized protein with GYD domain
MPKYLYAATYTKEGFDGVRAKGAQDRIDAVRTLTESVGGTLEAFYFAFGDVDAYVIMDLPDDETAAAMSLAVSASGRVNGNITKLLTAAQIDGALGKSPDYRPPGG